MLYSKKQTVLIFDSGVGGLSVYQDIRALLPQLNYIYMFDNEAYPYGELAPERLIQRVRNGITRFVRDHNIDMVVIACNTASTIVLPTLRSLLTIPVVGVVPAIKPASALVNKGMGLIATPATILRPYTHELIRQFASHQKVELLGSTRLVYMAESKLRGQAVSLDELATILHPLQDKIDVAVLGCTHFPLLRSEIGEVLGKGVRLVDSGQAIARRVKALLQIEESQNQEAIPKPEARHQIYSSAPPWEEGALNLALHQLGFMPVQPFPIQDALDH